MGGLNWEQARGREKVNRLGGDRVEPEEPGVGRSGRVKKRKKKKKKRKPEAGWWWTPSRRDGKCEGQGCKIKRGDPICFRAEPRRVLCEACAVAEGIAKGAKMAKAMRENRKAKRPAVR